MGNVIVSHITDSNIDFKAGSGYTVYEKIKAAGNMAGVTAEREAVYEDSGDWASGF